MAKALRGIAILAGAVALAASGGILLAGAGTFLGLSAATFAGIAAIASVASTTAAGGHLLLTRPPSKGVPP